MSLVRRHLVAAVSVLLALATGVALGAGPLSRESLVPTRVVTAPPAAETSDDHPADDLADSVAPSLTRERLAGRSVALVSTPGVDEASIEALTADIEGAGGSVPAHWQVGQSLVAVGETALVDTLGEQLLDQLGDGVADPDAPPYERMGQLLGSAVATRGERSAVPGEDQVTVRQSIDAASLLSTDVEEPRVAPLVLLVLGDDIEDAVVEGLTTGLVARAGRVVVAAATPGGDLTALDELDLVTTVDGIDGATGRLASVLALAAPEDRPIGSYGASGSDGVLPLG